MPIFEFACARCGHRFEALVMGSRRAACPNCGSIDLEKLFSTFAAGRSGASVSHGASAPRFT